jgi:hypothetical protein
VRIWTLRSAFIFLSVLLAVAGKHQRSIKAEPHAPGHLRETPERNSSDPRLSFLSASSAFHPSSARRGNGISFSDYLII